MIKQLLIRLGLWQDRSTVKLPDSTLKMLEDMDETRRLHPERFPSGTLVDEGWLKVALKHYCGICERWFSDVRGKLMHDRHRHKPSIFDEKRSNQ